LARDLTIISSTHLISARQKNPVIGLNLYFPHVATSKMTGACPSVCAVASRWARRSGAGGRRPESRPGPQRLARRLDQPDPPSPRASRVRKRLLGPPLPNPCRMGACANSRMDIQRAFSVEIGGPRPMMMSTMSTLWPWIKTA
jgi:hypothetical protein